MFHLGRDCLCRREAPKLARFTSPLCWRCCGMLAGVLIACVALATLGDWVGEHFLPHVGGLFTVPAVLEAFSELEGSDGGRQLRRLGTGFFLGAALPVLFKALMCSLA